VISQAILIVGLSEHLPDIKAVGLRELAGRLPSSLRIEDTVHCIEHVAGILCGGEIG
jgi:hypothetical protein